MRKARLKLAAACTRDQRGKKKPLRQRIEICSKTTNDPHAKRLTAAAQLPFSIINAPRIPILSKYIHIYLVVKFLSRLSIHWRIHGTASCPFYFQYSKMITSISSSQYKNLSLYMVNCCQSFAQDVWTFCLEFRISVIDVRFRN